MIVTYFAHPRITGEGRARQMVMRKRVRGVFIGTLVLRHSPHHALLTHQGWDEIAPETIGPTAPQPWPG